MKVLFVNELKNATITALAPNANYPASNLNNVFAKLKYKGVGYSDTIKATLPDNVTANCFFYTYTNAESMEVRVYSNASVLLETVTVNCTYNSGAEFFTSHDNVRWIEIDIAAPVSEDVYLGGIAIGDALTFPCPISNFDKDLSDNSNKTESSDGQVSHGYIKPLESYSLQFTNVKRADYHEIIERFKAVGSGHIWVDITEENHAVYQPLYCVSNMVESPSRDKTMVNFKLKLKEAR